MGAIIEAQKIIHEQNDKNQDCFIARFNMLVISFSLISFNFRIK